GGTGTTARTADTRYMKGSSETRLTPRTDGLRRIARWLALVRAGGGRIAAARGTRETKSERRVQTSGHTHLTRQRTQAHRVGLHTKREMPRLVRRLARISDTEFLADGDGCGDRMRAARRANAVSHARLGLERVAGKHALGSAQPHQQRGDAGNHDHRDS